jgi:hypothetical protein
LNLLDNIKSNYLKEWNFSYLENNINHLHMNWKLRQDNDSVLASFLLPYLKKEFDDKDHIQEINQINLAHFLCNFFSIEKSKTTITYNPFSQEYYDDLIAKLKNLNIIIPKNIDSTLFNIIQINKIDMDLSEDALDKIRQRLIEFGEKIKVIQHYCYHTKIFSLSKIMGKLLTRIWWIYHSSSPVMKPLYDYDKN